MIRITDIENRLMEIEQGMFQKVCNEILCMQGYTPYKYTGSVKGKNKTKKGTPDSVFMDNNKKYVYVEMTTQEEKIYSKVKKDVEKCLKKINDNPTLKNKVTKIIFLHNSENPEEFITEEIKELCGNIEFEIHGLEYISSQLQIKYPDIAISLLGVKDDSQIVTKISDDDLNKIASVVNQENVSQYKNNTIEEIKTKINNLYKRAIDIINSDEAMIYISSNDKKELKSIYNMLSVFDFYYKDKEDEDAKLYYHNLLVILSKYDYLEGIKFYSSIPDFAKNNDITAHFYTMLLIQKGDFIQAKELLENLYFNKKYEFSFETLIRAYFLSRNYDKVIELLSSAKIDKFDRYGFLASILIISKNKCKKYTESEIVKLNNSKFRKMPIFYSCTSQLLYKLDKRKNKFKDQFKKGLKLLNEKDIIVINTMCDQAMEIGLEDEIINYLSNIDLSPFLQTKLLELISNKKELTLNQIALVQNIDIDSLDGNFDKDYILAKVSESKGKEIEALRMYKISFENNGKMLSGYKYIKLSIKNKSKIDEVILEKIIANNTISSLMLGVEAYVYMGNYSVAKKCSYRALYLAKNNFNYKNVFRQFWSTVMFGGNKDYKELNHVVKDCVVVLKNTDTNKKITILLEDDNYFRENDKIMDAIITRTYSELGSDLLSLKNEDIIEINYQSYIIKEIFDKYSYFTRMSFRYIKNNKHIKLYTSNSDSPKDSIEEIRQDLIQINKDINNRLDMYQENKNIPLSALLSNEYNFDEYAKLINTLLGEPTRVLLAGETIDLDLNKGFVLDITTLVVLSIMDILDLIPEEILNKTYITTSTKNKFQYYYESLLLKHDETEGMIYIVDNEKLAMYETQLNERIKFWKKLNKFLNKVNVVDTEFEKDGLLNDKTKTILDKVQFDSIKLSQELNVPLVCDDLFIRRLANQYGVKHTNSIQIVKTYSESFEAYISVLIEFAKKNYIYTLYDNVLSEILKNLYENFNEENKTHFINIMKIVFENRISFEYYVPIFLNRLENIKSIQYIKIFDDVYENLFATFFIEIVEKEIKSTCIKYSIDLKTMI